MVTFLYYFFKAATFLTVIHKQIHHFPFLISLAPSLAVVSNQYAF